MRRFEAPLSPRELAGPRVRVPFIAALTIAACLSVGACKKPQVEPAATAPATETQPNGTPSAAAALNAAAQKETGEAPGFGWKDLAPVPTISLKAQLAEEAKTAAAAHRKPIAYLHASWCPPCNAIDKFHGDPRMQDAFAGTHIVRIDVDQFGEKDLMDAQLVTTSIPKFFPLDANGRPTGRNIGGSAWAEDVPENMAPPLKKFFSEN